MKAKFGPNVAQATLTMVTFFFSYVDSTRMISVGGVGNVIEGDLSEMLRNCNLAREEDESLKNSSDNFSSNKLNTCLEITNMMLASIISLRLWNAIQNRQ